MQGTKFFAASVATILPTKVEPVKQMRSNFWQFIFMARLGPPFTTAMASVSMYLSISFLIMFDVAGVISDGLTNTQFPAAMAETMGFNVTTSGTFQVP
jgi:hypothetical protein